MTIEHVSGKNSGHIMLYALSTCGWCARTKKLLDEIGVDYYYQYVDHLKGEERQRAINEVDKWNPGRSFPTLVIDNKRCIIGYKEDEIREVLNK